MAVKSITAPIGGWDVKSSLHDMPEDRASVLDNWFPAVGRVEMRPGYTEHATGLTGDVETLAEFISGSTRKLVACANNKIWDVTAAGAGTDITDTDYLTGSITVFADGGGGQVTVTSVAHGLTENDTVVITGTTSYNGTFTATNLTADTYEITDTWVADDATGTWTHNAPQTITVNRWQTANFDGKMGLVNGTDAPLQYDGTTISLLSITGSGLTEASIVGINVFSNRTYFWMDNSQDFWYSAVNALGGACTKFPLSRVGMFGGKLLAMGTWTRDGGSGVNDLAAFFMTSGEVIIYNGTNPADFTLVGVFRIAPPLSIRGVVKIGGDLIVMTKDGYVSLERAISKDRMGSAGSISDQIDPAITADAKAYGSNWGWQAFHYPAGNMLIFNIPVSTNNTYQQHVFATHTGAPCRFKNIHARCWGLYNDGAYFGGSGSVYRFDNAYNDNGAVIDCDCMTATTFLGSDSHQKHITGVQPFTLSDGEIALTIDVASDYGIPLAAYESPTFTGGASDWDTAEWDTATWGGGDEATNTLNDWRSEHAFGYNFRSNVKLRSKNQKVKWYSINYMFTPGGLV